MIDHRRPLPLSGRSCRHGAALCHRGRQEGLQFTGKAKVGDKQEWPRWIPTAEMSKRDPKKYGQYKDGMDGGPEQSARRARHLPLPGQDGHPYPHPWHDCAGDRSEPTRQTAAFRMINEHVIDLYDKVKIGAEVVVL